MGANGIGWAEASPLRAKHISTPGAALAAQAKILSRTFPPGRVFPPDSIHLSVNYADLSVHGILLR
jgi:hypothetical protein